MFGRNWKGKTGGWILGFSGIARALTAFVPEAAVAAEVLEMASLFFEGTGAAGAGLAVYGIRERQGKARARPQNKKAEGRP